MIVKNKLPNIYPSEISTFQTFIQENSIQICSHPAIVAYTGKKDNCFESANIVNHSLTLAGNPEPSEYSGLASLDYSNNLDAYQFRKSVQTLDSLFSDESLSVIFSSQSMLFKGINLHEPFYQILKLDQVQVNDTITFLGFISTTVSMGIACNFARPSNEKIILTITSLDKIKALLPKLVSIESSINGPTPELEILLNRGHTFQIREITQANNIKFITIATL